MDIIQAIRNESLAEEFDYLFLLQCLSKYKNPRDKITKLLRSGAIIRVKKGLYVWGAQYRRRPISSEVLANIIYGPSYVSFEYALSYYGLIPEGVKRVTSACSKRFKHYETPLGEFVYYYISKKKFSLGTRFVSVDDKVQFRIATKEKAMCDVLAQLKPFESATDLEQYLIEGMRIEKESLETFNRPLTKEIVDHYSNNNVDLLWQILKR